VIRDRSLRRGTDRVEDIAAWLLTALGIVVLIAAGVLGTGDYAKGMERVRSDRAERVQATAVVIGNPQDRIVEPGSAAPFVPLPARWTDPARAQHAGEVLARSNSRAGTRIQVWLDRKGELAPPPSTELGAVLSGLVVAVTLLAMGGCVIVALWKGLRRMTAAHNTRAWEREWARVGPEWTSQQPK
jgi:hypothetical protein